MAEKEYIERGAALDAITYIPIEKPTEPNIIELTLLTAQRQIRKVPAADVVEVRHEKWVNNHCTGCGVMPLGEEMWTRLGLTPPKFEWFMDFCPICGAKMDGEGKCANE